MNAKLLISLAAALLMAYGPTAQADLYYLKDDGSRWRTSDGKPLTGAHKASTLICKEGTGCYGLIYAGKGHGGWRQRGPLWAQVHAARQQLSESDSDRVELAPELGNTLYNAAREGYWRTLQEQ